LKPQHTILTIITCLCICLLPAAKSNAQPQAIPFFGDTVWIQTDTTIQVPFGKELTETAIENFYQQLLASKYPPVLKALIQFKEKNKPDDWLYYQLIRKTAQQLSPKAANYNRYTLYKWFLLTQSGYDAILTISQQKMLFYVRCNEYVYNIPTRYTNAGNYVCLNYHDYGSVDFESEKFRQVKTLVPTAKDAFSYKVTQLPNFLPSDYKETELQFNYRQNDYHFKVKLNQQIKQLFANYPVVDYNYYFNIPLSKETYTSLIPALKNDLKKKSKKNGVAFLMRFTRYAFLFEQDSTRFGKEKRMSPEETLSYDYSDCEDRAALFFYLVKEIYNLPMIVLVYPQHVTIAVQFDKPIGKIIEYNGKKYTVCEPTPQQQDLKIGQLLPTLNNSTYEVVYVYDPAKK
jgi:hypothetical protein